MDSAPSNAYAPFVLILSGTLLIIAAIGQIALEIKTRRVIRKIEKRWGKLDD